MADLQQLRAWIGREQTVEDVLARMPARGLAALLDRDAGWIRPGAELPPLWHWLYLQATPAESHLGPDGHERLGEFLPPAAQARRVWAGGRLRFLRPLCLEGAATRRSTVSDVQEKRGRAGAFLLVTVHHEIGSRGESAIVEDQQLAYLPQLGAAVAPEPGPAEADRQALAAAPPAAPSSATPAADTPPEPVDPAPDWSERFDPTPVALFRFSALTFNSHRIHYDEPYATDVEGYAGLVVHGPLLALLLLDAAGRACGRAPAAYEYRALAPAFAGAPIAIEGYRLPDGAALRAVDAQGRVFMTGTAHW